jgi:hypothetical protein
MVVIGKMADAESSRITKEDACVRAAATAEIAAHLAETPLCPCKAPIPLQHKTTQSESNRILRSVTRCPIFTVNKIPPFPCAFTTSPSQATLDLHGPPSSVAEQTYPYVTTPPNALYQYRSYQRIRGIDQIVTVVRTQSASETTTRRLNAVIYGNVAPTTTFFRKPVPPPPCIVTAPPLPPYPPAPPCRQRRL